MCEFQAGVMQTDVHYSKCINLTALVKLKPKLLYLGGPPPLLSAMVSGGKEGVHNQGEAHKAYCNVIEFTPLAVTTTHHCMKQFLILLPV